MRTRHTALGRLALGAGLAALAITMTTLPAPTAVAVPSGVTARIVDGDLQLTGGDRNDTITIALRSTDPRIVEVRTGLTRAPEFAFRRAAVDRITVDTAGGADRVSIDDRFGVVGEDTPITISSGDGSDVLTGGAGEEVVLAGSGADTVDPGPGADEVLLGSGDDRLLWSTADGKDVIEGQTGADEVVVDGTTAADHLEVTANGARLRVSRPGLPGSVEASAVETWTLRPGAGADSVVVNDLTGSANAVVTVDLDVPGGASSDGSADTVEVAGTAGADDIRADLDGDAIEISGVADRVRVAGGDFFVDRLVVDADLGADTLRARPNVGDLMPVRLEGGPGQDKLVVDGTPVKDDISVGTTDGRVEINQSGDVMTASTEQTEVRALGGDDLVRVVAPVDELTDLAVDGGTGADSLAGSAGSELLIGGDGGDQLVGNGGDDVLIMGAGDDNAFWSAGDGEDLVEGGVGADALQIVGDDGVDQFNVSPVGSRVRVQRGDQLQDLGGIERLSLFPLRGADEVRMHDLSGTDLDEVTADLSATVGGAGDNALDRVFVTATNGNDTISLAGDRDFLVAQGMPWSPRVRHTDGLLDRLAIETGLGVDTVSTSGLTPGTITVSVT